MRALTSVASLLVRREKMGTPVARALSRTHSAPGARSRSRSVITASHSCARSQRSLALVSLANLRSIIALHCNAEQAFLELQCKAALKPMLRVRRDVIKARYARPAELWTIGLLNLASSSHKETTTGTLNPDPQRARTCICRVSATAFDSPSAARTCR